jgi:hypothetical protein
VSIHFAHQRGDVEVGVREVVKGLVVAEVIGVGVLVPSDEGVNIPDRPDELVLGLEVVGGVVLGAGGFARLKELPLIVVVEVPPGVGAAGGVAVDVGLDAAVEAVVLTEPNNSDTASPHCHAQNTGSAPRFRIPGSPLHGLVATSCATNISSPSLFSTTHRTMLPGGNCQCSSSGS